MARQLRTPSPLIYHLFRSEGLEKSRLSEYTRKQQSEYSTMTRRDEVDILKEAILHILETATAEELKIIYLFVSHMAA